MANTRQFKTRDSATAFMRKHGVTKEYYNNFLTTDTIGGKPVFIVDVEDMETFIDLKKSDEKHGTNCADGNYSKEDEDGNITQGEYHNEDKKPTKKKQEQPEKTSDLGKTELGKRLRERVEKNKKPTIEKEPRKKVKVDPETRKRNTGAANAPATIGILKQFPDLPIKSIRAMCRYLILEGLDNDTVFGAMKEIFSEELCVGKQHYPRVYRNELIKAQQLKDNGRPKK